jgi:hypothetical protein
MGEERIRRLRLEVLCQLALQPEGGLLPGLAAQHRRIRHMDLGIGHLLRVTVQRFEDEGLDQAPWGQKFMMRSMNSVLVSWVGMTRSIGNDVEMPGPNGDRSPHRVG